MHTFPSLANRLWLLFQGKEHRRFWQDAPRLQAVQAGFLANILHKNRATAFGKQHHFARLLHYKDFAQQVPILDNWASVEPFINRIANGEQGILTAEPVLRFEETSGTTGFSKLIPYTASLKKAFEQAVAVWMCELNLAEPAVFAGKAYWSISPALKATRTTPGGLPIGLTDDTAYFNPLTAWLLRQIIVQPVDIKNEKDTDRFYLKTLAHLLKTPDLTFVSVWSPTFFLQMDQYLQQHHASLGVEKDATWAQVFPRLACLSCWTDAQASVWMPAVQQRLGAVPVQGKGLLSTEGVTTIPIGSTGQCVLAYRSHFFEFRSVPHGEVLLAEGLIEGHEYEVIMTNGAGLYRYATQDVVRCEGWLRGLPVLRFMGRRNAQSDLVGEKLSEQQVIAAIHASGLAGAYAEVLVAPFSVQATGQAKYEVLLFGAQQPEFDHATSLQRMEAVLCLNPYYRQALDTHQLLPLQMKVLSESPVAKIKEYLQATKQIKEGDLKIPILLGREMGKFFG